MFRYWRDNLKKTTRVLAVAMTTNILATNRVIMRQLTKEWWWGPGGASINVLWFIVFVNNFFVFVMTCNHTILRVYFQSVLC